MSRSFSPSLHIFTTSLFLIVALLGLMGCSGSKQEKKEVALAIWGNYLTPEAQQRFTQKTGIKLNISNYSSNEELLAKIQSGASGIDVAVPSDYMVEIMIKTDLLAPLDTTKITHFAEFDPYFLRQVFDPENKYSVPYGWGTAGIAINRDLYQGEIKSWKDVLENKELEGKFSLLDDVRETVGLALKYVGASVNSTDPGDLARAKVILTMAKKKLKMFRTDTIEALTNKEIAVAHAYQGDTIQAQMKKPNIEYIIPTEGGTRSVDSLVILKNSKNKEAALALINFLADPEVEIELVKQTGSGPVFKGMKNKLPDNIKMNKALFPDQGIMDKLEMIHDLGEKTPLYDEIWTSVKTN